MSTVRRHGCPAGGAPGRRRGGPGATDGAGAVAAHRRGCGPGDPTGVGGAARAGTTGAPAALLVLRESTEQNIGAILATLAFGVEAGAIEPPVGTLALLRQTVAGGGDVATILHAYRVGHEQLWRVWADHVATRVDPADLHLVLRLSSEHIFTFINSACENLVNEYRLHFSSNGQGQPSARDHILALLGSEEVDLRQPARGWVTTCVSITSR